MKIKKITDFRKVDGTSFHQIIIKASKDDLTRILGPEHYHIGGAEDKRQYEWEIEINGKVMTIYDWKEYRDFDANEVIEWHVGNYDGVDVHDEVEYLKSLL